MSDNPNKNLFKRGDVWWLEVRVKGHKVKESLATNEVVVARKRRDKRIEELQLSGGEKLSWGDVTDKWFASFITKKGRSQATATRYYVSLKQVEPILAKYNVDKIDGRVILNMIEARKKAGVSESTIRRDLTAVSAVLKFAEDRNWREGNPAVAKRRLLDENNEPIVLPTDEEIEAVVTSCPSRFGAMVRAARYTGCRQGELVSARWDQFNEARRTLTIIGKRSKRRTIDLSNEALALIRSMPRIAHSPLIFCREDGGSFMQAASNFVFFRAMANEKRKQKIVFRFHDLRHLYAVESLHNGMSIYVLQKQLGHTTIRMTERYLEHLSPEEQDHARRGTILDAVGAIGADAAPQSSPHVVGSN